MAETQEPTSEDGFTTTDMPLEYLDEVPEESDDVRKAAAGRANLWMPNIVHAEPIRRDPVSLLRELGAVARLDLGRWLQEVSFRIRSLRQARRIQFFERLLQIPQVRLLRPDFLAELPEQWRRLGSSFEIGQPLRLLISSQDEEQ